MDSSNVQQFFAIPELVEQVILELEELAPNQEPTEREVIDSRIAYIQRLGRLRTINPFFKNLIDGSPKIRRRMNLERLDNDGLSYQVSATIVDDLLKSSQSSWGCDLAEFNFCQVEDDEADVIVYDIEGKASNSAATNSVKSTIRQSSCKDTKLAPNNMSTVVRINLKATANNEATDYTFVLPPGATINDLFATFDDLSVRSKPESTTKRSWEEIDDEETATTSAKMLKRTKHRCEQHPGWESCIHLDNHLNARSEGLIMYSA